MRGSISVISAAEVLVQAAFNTAMPRVMSIHICLFLSLLANFGFQPRYLGYSQVTCHPCCGGAYYQLPPDKPSGCFQLWAVGIESRTGAGSSQKTGKRLVGQILSERMGRS